MTFFGFWRSRIIVLGGLPRVSQKVPALPGAAALPHFHRFAGANRVGGRMPKFL
jgi:hypothetical protein